MVLPGLALPPHQSYSQPTASSTLQAVTHCMHCRSVPLSCILSVWGLFPGLTCAPLLCSAQMPFPKHLRLRIYPPHTHTPAPWSSKVPHAILYFNFWILKFYIYSCYARLRNRLSCHWVSWTSLYRVWHIVGVQSALTELNFCFSQTNEPVYTEGLGLHHEHLFFLPSVSAQSWAQWVTQSRSSIKIRYRPGCDDLRVWLL
jgi:hypothetical protein